MTSEPKIMKQLHTRREQNYEKMKHISIPDQVKMIQAAAAPIKKRILDRIKKALPASSR